MQTLVPDIENLSRGSPLPVQMYGMYLYGMCHLFKIFLPPVRIFGSTLNLMNFWDREAAEPSSVYGWPPSIKLTMGFSTIKKK